MNLIKLIAISSLLTLWATATIYEDAEDGTTSSWRVSDAKPAGAVVSNIFDTDKNSNVIQFEGEGRRNAYSIGAKKGANGWKNSHEKSIKWSMNFSEKFKFSLYADTEKGRRIFQFDYKNRDKGFYKKRYIKMGLGSKSMQGEWVDIHHNLEADLKRFEPDNSLIAINGMKIQGSGKIDNIELFQSDILTSKVERIKIPFREHGYSQLSSVVIGSEKSLDRFLNKVVNASGFNEKEKFLKGLKDTPIDFKKWNLLFYRMTETSGSIKLFVAKPVVDGNHVRIQIKREVPEIGTSDMAYYGLAYIVSKNIKDITFDNGVQEVVIANQESDMVIPENCQAWFDGCNHCSRLDSGKAVCTKRYCLIYNPQDFKCTQWEKQEKR